jgi:hypothetical protein
MDIYIYNKCIFSFQIVLECNFISNSNKHLKKNLKLYYFQNTCYLPFESEILSNCQSTTYIWS